MTDDEITEIRLTLWAGIGHCPGTNDTALRRAEALLDGVLVGGVSCLVTKKVATARRAFQIWFSSGRWRQTGRDGAAARDALYGAVWELATALRSRVVETA